MITSRKNHIYLIYTEAIQRNMNWDIWGISTKTMPHNALLTLHSEVSLSNEITYGENYYQFGSFAQKE